MEATSFSSTTSRQDGEHLQLLAIFHYVVAGLGALFACFPLMYVAMGVLLIVEPGFMTQGQKAPPPPALFGYFFIVIGVTFSLLGWACAVCTLISGRYLAKRRKRMFSFVMAAILCMFFPFGTALGVFTIIVLSRESVQRLYETAAGNTDG